MQSSETEFARIFESGKYLDLLELSDANLRTDDGCNFDIHRVILAASSDYFRRMFLGMGERRRKFHIPGISGECLNDILCYVYTGNIRVTERNVADLMIVADYLLMDDLLTKIKDNFGDNLTEVNCLRILQVAHQIGQEDIFRKCFRFIQTRFEGIMRFQTDELADLPLEVLKKFLSNRSLYVYDETTVWQAIVAWTQKDVPHRVRYVPQLLLTLAVEDMTEELATEIVQHEIISENFFEGAGEIAHSYYLSTNIELLLTFLKEGYLHCYTELTLHHRIPLQLLVVMSYVDEGEKNLYITYDENTDLSRKITGLSFLPDKMTAIGRNIYIFNRKRRMCMNFDLGSMDWVRMQRFRYYYDESSCIVATDAYIYLLGEEPRVDIYVEVYDIESNRWQYGVPPRNITGFYAEAIERKIYVVGYNTENLGAMTTQMFDPDAQQWSVLSPPTLNHLSFVLVAYHQKLYLIGGSEAEVFDPATNLWKKMPDTLRKRSAPTAMVFNDRIIVCDTKIPGYNACWNDAEERWEEFGENDTCKGLCRKHYVHIHNSYTEFCTVDDVETIKMITKQNRDPETRMEYKYLF